MAECFVMEFKSNLYVKVLTLPGFEMASSVVFSTAVDIADDEDGMCSGCLFKPRVEAREQMAQNSAKLHGHFIVCSSYFLFQLFYA